MRHCSNFGVGELRIIAARGKLAGHPAAQALDARYCIVAPGFIDVHTHDEQGLVRQPGTNARVPGSDGIPLGDRPHPLPWGSFPRALCHHGDARSGLVVAGQG